MEIRTTRRGWFSPALGGSRDQACWVQWQHCPLSHLGGLPDYSSTNYKHLGPLVSHGRLDCTTCMEVEFEDFLWKVIVFCLFCFGKIVKNEPRAWSHSKPSFQVFQNSVREAGRSRSLLLGFPSPSAAELRRKWPCAWSAYTAPHPQVSKADSGPVLQRQAAGRLLYLSALLPSEAPLRQPPDCGCFKCRWMSHLLRFVVFAFLFGTD